MKPMFSLSLALLLFAAVAAPAQSPVPFVDPNVIGVFVEVPTPTDVYDQTCLMGPEPATLYVVILNPYDEVGGVPIDVIGLVEFRMELPAGVILLAATFPFGVGNLNTPPDYLLAGSMPVVGPPEARTAIGMSVMVFNPTSAQGGIDLRPVGGTSDILMRGSSPVTGLIVPTPLTGDYDTPVFAFGLCELVVPTEETAWGSLRALYR